MKYVLPQDLKSFGLIPELIGRLPVLTYLNPLDRDALTRILIEPKNSIVRQYEKLFQMDGITLTFSDDALKLIVDKAVEYKLGARGLRGLMETIMAEPMYELPNHKQSDQHQSFTVTKEYARQKLRTERLVQLRNAS
jgi:ATP-dependent Clp protease ATP-binding subunit ClpX